jgi:drug/metabolite transporter (DMT)-like permease
VLSVNKSEFLTVRFQLLIGTLSIGFAPIFVKMAELNTTVAGFYRNFFAAIILSLVVLIFRRPMGVSSVKDFYLPIIAGVVFAVDLFVWHRSIMLAGAGVATVLANTQVFYLNIFSCLLLQQKISMKFFILVLLAFVGVVLIAFDFGGGVRSDKFFLGAIYGVITGVIYATFVMIMRKMERDHPIENSTDRLLIVSWFAAFVLLILCLFEGEVSFELDGTQLSLMLALALVSHVLGWVLLPRALAKVSLGVGGLWLLVQPAFAVIVAWMFLGEKLTIMQICGIFLTLFAIGLCRDRST